MNRRTYFILAIVVVAPCGCSTNRTTDTARTGREQLLISNAVDRSLDEIDFTALQGAGVYLDEKYLDGVDKNYVVAATRHQVLNAGGRLVTKPEESDVTVEIRSGGIGTDMKDTFIGVPEIAVPLPFPVQLPEVRLFETSTQYGTAKIGLVAYATNSRQSLGSGGVSLARSDDKNFYVLGVGPFNRGAIRDEFTQSSHESGFPAASGAEVAASMGDGDGPKHVVFEKLSDSKIDQ